MKKILAVWALIFVTLSLALTGCAKSSGVNIADAKCIDDLSGARIGAQAGTFHAQALNQIKDVKASHYPEFTDLFVALESGAIDGYLAEDPSAFSICAENSDLTYIPLVNNDTGFSATEADVGIAIGIKKGSLLREQINDVLKTLTDEDKQTLMKEIVDIVSGKDVTELSLKSEAPADPKGTLKVAMECAYEPFNWTETGKKSLNAVEISGEGKEGLYANGYDVQIARYVANKLGLKLEIYAVEWDSLIPALQSGAVDAIVAGMSPTEERKEEINFTRTYYESNIVVIVKKQAGSAVGSFLKDVWTIIKTYYPQLLTGVLNTLLISLAGTMIGLIIGLLIGIIRTAPESINPVLRVIQKIANVMLSVYIEIFRGTPMMVQAMVIYWGYAFATGGKTLALMPSAILIVSINTGAYMAEIVRGGILSIDKGQYEGAMSIGMTHNQAMFMIIIPQVLRNILPSVSNEFVINIKDTSVLNVIGVTELYYFAGVIKRQNFQTFQTYLVVCILYLIMTYSITHLLKKLERRLDVKHSYEVTK